ncbi:hypothetical protein MMC07_002070 [Pseudocyphellaria aurata]|nr:hypothetical protein [Pseudocyphellaria aurata]
MLSLGSAISANAVSCWNSGPSVLVENIQPQIVEICDYLQSEIPGYLKGEERYKCVTDAAGVKWYFALTFIGDNQDSRLITSAECQDGMNKQISQCKFGGETSYGNWKYRADPDGGHC